MHGEQLAGEIEKRRGQKPKAGTIYPALKDLKNKKLVARQKKGKTVKYSITPEGKRAIKQAQKYFIKCFNDVFLDSK